MKAIELSENNLDRAKALLGVRKDAYPKGRPTAEGEAADLLRAIIVFELAALDSYVHKRVIERVEKTVTGERRLPHACITAATRSIKQADLAKEMVSIALNKKPANEILKRLTKSLSFETFQKPESIDKAFEMMELKSPWDQINRLITPKRGRKRPGRKQDSRAFILRLVQRRDDIVHEGDVYLGRKFHGKLKKISRTEVAKGIDVMRRIVEAMEKISQ